MRGLDECMPRLAKRPAYRHRTGPIIAELADGLGYRLLGCVQDPLRFGPVLGVDDRVASPCARWYPVHGQDRQRGVLERCVRDGPFERLRWRDANARHPDVLAAQ